MNDGPGYEAMWGYFGLSRASWLVLPRVLVHGMPDEWQGRMAALLDEFHATYTNVPAYEVHVQLKQSGRFIKMPDWVGYRHPDMAVIERFKGVASE